MNNNNNNGTGTGNDGSTASMMIEAQRRAAIAAAMNAQNNGQQQHQHQFQNQQQQLQQLRKQQENLQQQIRNQQQQIQHQHHQQQHQQHHQRQQHQQQQHQQQQDQRINSAAMGNNSGGLGGPNGLGNLAHMGTEDSRLALLNSLGANSLGANSLLMGSAAATNHNNANGNGNGNNGNNTNNGNNNGNNMNGNTNGMGGQNNLTFTTQDAAQRAVMHVLARHNTSAADESTNGNGAEDSDKRKRGEDSSARPSKKTKPESNDGNTAGGSDLNTSNMPRLNTNSDGPGPAPVAASEKGLAYFNDNDVLSGRGGGTNVHPGNRHFRDLINLHRRSYLKARKNDKPAISRAIVRSVRENNGRFLKRDEKSGLWFEIGDDAAREKTSQALRQRAPEMRKILFESEREQARQEAEEQLRQQQILTAGLGANPMGDFTGLGAGNLGTLNPAMLQQGGNHMLNPLLAMQMNKNHLTGGQMPMQNDPYSQMSQNLMTAALLGGGINRFTPNGA